MLKNWDAPIAALVGAIFGTLASAVINVLSTSRKEYKALRRSKLEQLLGLVERMKTIFEYRLNSYYEVVVGQMTLPIYERELVGHQTRNVNMNEYFDMLAIMHMYFPKLSAPLKHLIVQGDELTKLVNADIARRKSDQKEQLTEPVLSEALSKLERSVHIVERQVLVEAARLRPWSL